MLSPARPVVPIERHDGLRRRTLRFRRVIIEDPPGLLTDLGGDGPHDPVRYPDFIDDGGNGVLGNVQLGRDVLLEDAFVFERALNLSWCHINLLKLFRMVKIMNEQEDIIAKDIKAIFEHLNAADLVAKKGVRGKTFLMPAPKQKNIPADEKLFRLYLFNENFEPVIVVHGLTLMSFGAFVMPVLQKHKPPDDEIVPLTELAGSFDEIEKRRKDGKWSPKKFFGVFVFIGPTLSMRHDLTPEGAKELYENMKPLGVKGAPPESWT